MELISREEAQQILDDCEYIGGYAHKVASDALAELPTRGVIRDCNGCFGASFGDCATCDKWGSE